MSGQAALGWPLTGGTKHLGMTKISEQHTAASIVLAGLACCRGASWAPPAALHRHPCVLGSSGRPWEWHGLGTHPRLGCLVQRLLQPLDEVGQLALVCRRAAAGAHSSAGGACTLLDPPPSAGTGCNVAASCCRRLGAPTVQNRLPLREQAILQGTGRRRRSGSAQFPVSRGQGVSWSGPAGAPQSCLCHWGAARSRNGGAQGPRPARRTSHSARHQESIPAQLPAIPGLMLPSLAARPLVAPPPAARGSRERRGGRQVNCN